MHFFRIIQLKYALGLCKVGTKYTKTPIWRLQKYTLKCQFGITEVIKFYKKTLLSYVLLLILEEFFINLQGNCHALSLLQV